ncbi:hypothetical protein NG895_14450 [Aeoliella sp. ICT_H6.2]|uniref:Uncharacterized protein n=1 Tax=Aeoliella straminimaris TaxID=2954799 RepID=A0A9X2FBC3_9BACT|nr:hypothetical protein [Aeoliella straminimaris]MCO6045108.1 hypothetical protein [Aeoliella straminimaris]
MLHRSCTTLLVALSFVMVADANGQLFGRRRVVDRASERDLKAMEEYYDDLEDYYEDRNPRLAREAERMEKYYEDLRKGRNVQLPAVSIPGVRLRVQERVGRVFSGERSVLVPSEPQVQRAAAQPSNGRWQSWGNSTPPAESSNTPPAEPTPAGAQEPTLAPPQETSLLNSPQPTEAYRVPAEEASTSGDLRFPPASSAADPYTRLNTAHGALVRDLNEMAEKNPQVARQWLDYLDLPRSRREDVASAEFYTTTSGREELTTTLERFDSVAGDPQFVAISRLPSFGRTRIAMRGLINWLEQQPTLANPGTEPDVVEELPAPPAK